MGADRRAPTRAPRRLPPPRGPRLQVRPASLVEAMAVFEADRCDGAMIHAAFLRAVRRRAARLPAFYFELGVRDEEAVASLADRVFTVAARQERHGAPWFGRRPFRAWLEAQADDATVLHQAVYGRRSLLAELLRSDLERARRRDPRVSWRDAVYRLATAGVGPPTAPLPGVIDPAEALDRAWAESPPGASPLDVVRRAQAMVDGLELVDLQDGAPVGPDAEARLHVAHLVHRVWDDLTPRQRALVISRGRAGGPGRPAVDHPDDLVPVASRFAAALGATEPVRPGGAAAVVEAACAVLVAHGVLPGTPWAALPRPSTSTPRHPPTRARAAR